MKISSEKLGLGDPGDPLYGLYLPVADLFLITYFDAMVLQNLKNLLSSKCATCMVEISSSPEYFHSIIDNTVCHNWTISRHDWDFIELAVNPEILQCRNLGLMQRSDSIALDLSLLSEFAKKSLFLITQLLFVGSMPLPVLAKKLNQQVIYPSMSAIEILDFFSGDLPGNMKTQVEKRLADLSKIRDQAQKECFEMIYWAKDLDQLSTYLRASNNPVIQLINAY